MSLLVKSAIRFAVSSVIALGRDDSSEGSEGVGSGSVVGSGSGSEGVGEVSDSGVGSLVGSAVGSPTR